MNNITYCCLDASGEIIAEFNSERQAINYAEKSNLVREVAVYIDGNPDMGVWGEL